MVKRILALTLIGLMAAVFIFPVCANALEKGEAVPQTLTATQKDPYDTTPTFAWTAISGPTSFNVTIGTGDAVSVSAGTFDDEGKWDARVADTLEAAQAGTDGKNCFKENEVTTCYYTPTKEQLPVELSVGTNSWTVAAIRAAGTKDEADPGFDGTSSTATGDAIVVLGDITLSLVADKTEAEIDDLVTVTVSMDNSANGAVPTDSVTFSVSYDGDILSLADPAYEITDRTTITPGVNASGSGADAKATVVLAGNIAEGTGDIVKLLFTVIGAGDNTFALVGDDITITSETVNPPVGEDRNPAVVGGDSAALTVAEPVLQGNLNGDEGVDLEDAILALQILAGMNTPSSDQEAVQAHVVAYGKVGVGTVLYIMTR